MKIGFIDYFLDEWHANNYPAWIKEASKGEMEVAFAYAKIDSPHGGMTTDEWCEKYGIERCHTIEELVEKSDALVVLSPDNCEMHEELCQIPLRSKKPTYVDKTFAPDLATARRIFEIAEQSGTPCYTTSALRYAAEYRVVDKSCVEAASLWGGGSFETYSIHQLEPLVMLMNAQAKRVMYLPGNGWLTLNIEFEDGRYGTITQFENWSPFVSNICTSKGCHLLNIESDFFHEFILELIAFFKTGSEKVPHRETLMIMALREAGIKAQKQPAEWVSVERI